MAGDASRAARPREFVVSGSWPNAELADHHGAHVAQHLARRLAAEMRRQRFSAKRLGAVSGVNRQTIANVLSGAVWPDLLTIANLEHALRRRLWPDFWADRSPGEDAPAGDQADGVREPGSRQLMPAVDCRGS